MIELLKTDFLSHYGIRRVKTVPISAETTSDANFDLTDGEKSMIVAYGSGNVSFDHPAKTETEVINYEQYLNGLSGTVFESGRKRCDCIMYEKGGDANRFFVLNEQTSTLGSTQLLSKPILDKKKNVLYPGGKYEKVEVQLSETLRTLISVPSISLFIGKYSRKVGLMSYVIIPRNVVISNAQSAFTTRYKQIESRETGEDGALLQCPSLNAFGFEYRRISHDYVFHIS